MANFDAQVIELVGVTYSTDQAALDQFITEGANEVINAMPRALMERVAEETTVVDGTTTSEGHKILHVLRNDGTIDQPCRLVLASKRGRIQDSSDMEFATTSDPAYYIQDGKINIFPNGNGLMASMPTYSVNSPIDASASGTITNFPNEYEYLVVLYAAIKALQQVLNSIVLADASISYSNASVGDGITAAVDSITVAPTDASGITDSDAPSDAAGSSDSAYTSPSVASDNGSEQLTSVTQLDSENTIDDFDGNAIEFDQWWATAAHLIEDEEDSELAQLQIAKISAYIDAFQAEVQDAQAAMQATIEDARQSTQASIANASNDVSTNNASIASRTQASIANASNDVNASIQKMQLSTQASIQKMQLSTNVNITNAAKTMEALIQDYAALVTEKTNEYNWALGQQAKLQADYDKGIQIMRGA